MTWQMDMKDARIEGIEEGIIEDRENIARREEELKKKLQQAGELCALLQAFGDKDKMSALYKKYNIN